MEKSIDAVRNKTRGIAEVSMCYTGDIQDEARKKYTLQYYKQFARELRTAVHTYLPSKI